MIGLQRGNLNDMTAVYVPDRSVHFHRVCFMNNFSKENAPKGKFGLIAEITANKGDGVYELSDKAISKHVVEGLNRQGIIDKEDVVFSRVARAKYAYVVYDLKYQKNIKIVREFIENRGIVVCGRFAEFEYLNMDACVRHALDLAKRMNHEQKK